MEKLQFSKQFADLLRSKLARVFNGDIGIFDVYNAQLSGDLSISPEVVARALASVAAKRNVVIEQVIVDNVNAYFPITIYDKIIGMAAINGKLDTINSSKNYISATIELIGETYLLRNKDEQNSEKLQNFLQEWLFHSEEKRSYNFRETAQMLGIDVDSLRVVVIVVGLNIENREIDILQKYLRKGEYILKFTDGKVAVISFAAFGIVERVLRGIEASGRDGIIYLGDVDADVNKSFLSAQNVLESSQFVVEKKNVYCSDDVAFEFSMLGMKNSSVVKKIWEQLNRKDTKGELKDTIRKYFYADGNNIEACETLYIHRNTLNYRLKKIETITGKNPKCFKNLYLLYCAVNFNVVLGKING